MIIKEAVFAGSSTKTAQRPQPSLPEFAFIGRSNVGKSSLINMLAGRKGLAMTSSKPGKTRLVNHFRINGQWYLVDLPGYGYAKASKSERDSIEAVIRDYLNFSEQMQRLFILIDSRHSLTSTDRDFLREVGGSDIPYAIIFTKADKQGPVATQKQVDSIKKEIEAVLGALPACFISSSEKGTGKEEILNFIEQTINL